MMDIMCAGSDVMNLCNVFKHWLLDCSTDNEHLHLSLPACLGDTPVVLKCDLQDRLINPVCIPIVREEFVSVSNYNCKGNVFLMSLAAMVCSRCVDPHHLVFVSAVVSELHKSNQNQKKG